MRHNTTILTALVLSLALMLRSGNAQLAQPVTEAPPTSLQKTLEKLKASQPVKIVCFGDSVTGVYYHTGGRRAYTAMVAVALEEAYPEAEVTAINAGISGNTTADGLRRIEKDVIAHKPDLVTVMFGLNDMVRVPIPEFKVNLGQIIKRCREAGAEVLLCTPNSVISTSNRRIGTLVEYCEAVREVADEEQTPLCDVHATFEGLRTRDPVAWRLMLSDEIHPNMDGHKLIAETICLATTGEKVSLDAAGPPSPAIPKTAALLEAGKPVRVLAMPPYDKMIGPALKAVVPSAQVEVKSWPTAGKTLAQIEQAAKGVRKSPPDFVLIGVPSTITPSVVSPPETAIRSYAWIFNWSLAFGRQQWDVVGIAPSVLKIDLTPEEEASDLFSRRMILAQDLHVIARSENDARPTEKILEGWLRSQLSVE
jgi:lysophospholipase L1-like esterase